VHVRVRLDTNPPDPTRQVRQIDAGARADLDDGSFEVGEELALVCAVDRVLALVTEREAMREEAGRGSWMWGNGE